MTWELKAVGIDSCYACEVHNQVYSFDNCKFLHDVTGSHLNGRNNDDVLCLGVANATLHSLPSKIETFFKNLEAIVINKSGLKEIQKKSLEPFKALRYLDLSKNAIENLEKDLFSSNENLQHLELSENKLTNLEEDLFKFNTELKIVNLEGNQFSISNFNWNAFNHLNKLDYLLIFEKKIPLEMIQLIDNTSKAIRVEQDLKHGNETTSLKPIENSSSKQICQDSTR